MTNAAKSNVKNVRTPGAPASNETGEKTTPTAEQQAEMDREAAELEAQLAAGDTEVDLTPPTPNPGTLAPDLQALVAVEVAKGIAAHAAAQRHAASQPADPSRDLPDASEIDAFAIRREVLTKQGYVVPAAYPQPAIPPALR